MSDENANKDVEESAKKVKNIEETGLVVQEMDKNIKSNKCNILCLVHQQGKIFVKNSKQMTNL